MTDSLQFTAKAKGENQVCLVSFQIKPDAIVEMEKERFKTEVLDELELWFDLRLTKEFKDKE